MKRRSEEERERDGSTGFGAEGYQALPTEVANALFPFLTWRETTALAQTCWYWHGTVEKASRAHVEWKNTVLEGRHGGDLLRQLAENSHGCLDVRFEPNFAVIVMSCVFEDDAWAECLLEDLANGGILPLGCIVVALIAGTIGSSMSSSGCHMTKVFKSEDDDNGVAMSVTVAHLPETSVEALVLEGDALKAFTDDATTPVSPRNPASNDTILVFSNDLGELNTLVQVLPRRYPHAAAVTGGVIAAVEGVTTIATSFAVLEQDEDQQQSAWERTMELSSNLVVRLSGRIGARAFASDAFQPVSPVLQCDQVLELQGENVWWRIYERLAVIKTDAIEAKALQSKPVPVALKREKAQIGSGHVWTRISRTDVAPADVSTTHCSLKDILNQYCPYSGDDAIGVYASEDAATLERLRSVARINAGETWMDASVTRYAPTSQLENHLATQDRHWELGDFGVLCRENPAVGHHAHRRTLTQLSNEMQQSGEKPLGAVVAKCGWKGDVSADEDFDENQHVEELNYSDIFPDTPVVGCIVYGEVGPLAMPNGQAARITVSPARFQTHSTCGLMFFDRLTA